MDSFDVAVIGGGLIGGSIAFELSAAGQRVVVFDRGQPGQEASWAAAGMLSPAADEPAAAPLVPLAKESLSLYPDFISAVESASRRKTGFAREGTIEIFASDEGEAARDKAVAEHRALGLPSEAMPLAEARRMEPGLAESAGAAMWLPYEATVEPRLLTEAVIEAARNRGATIRAETAVESLLCGEGRCTGVRAGGEAIRAECTVLAAGCFSGKIGADACADVALPPRVHPVRGQMIALRTHGVGLQRVLRSARGYLVPRHDGRIVAGSTLENAGFEKRVTAGGLRKILDAAEEIFPAIRDAEILDTWAGLRPATPDSLPLLGPSGLGGLLIATGHYRNGILLAPVTAKLIGEWIARGATRFDAAAFSPARFVRTKSGAEPRAPLTRAG
ncbi:MAG TPA: glycine oxidase ThiO [Candidatus Acidoferrales bacterium]|nr:glycine oxidase ThiO [Candidatus Acidoferrales bacterium]